MSIINSKARISLIKFNVLLIKEIETKTQREMSGGVSNVNYRLSLLLEDPAYLAGYLPSTAVN
jgi:hypothetical protein